MSDKQMKTPYLSGNLHVSYDVCIIRTTNHGQLSGHKTTFIQPLVAAVNCSLWVYLWSL